MNNTFKKLISVSIAGLIGVSAAAQADEKVINLYSARHYSTDEKMYEDFTKQTGIAIKRLELGDEALLGACAKRRRVYLRRGVAGGCRTPCSSQQNGLFRPVSPVLSDKIRHRLLVKMAFMVCILNEPCDYYNKANVDPMPKLKTWPSPH